MEASVNSLPSEILEIIFSYCTPSDLVHSIPYVCVRWREVAQSTMVWKYVTYCPEHHATSQQVVDMLKISPKLQNITLPNLFDDRVLKTITDNCAELRKLWLIDHPDLELDMLKSLQEKCKNLQYLSIPQQVLTDLDKCEVVGKFSHLKILHLTAFQPTRFLINLRHIADQCRELVDIEIRSVMFQMNDLQHLLSTRKCTLHTLGISCSNKFGECVLPTLSVCNLKSLSVFAYHDCLNHDEKIQHLGRLNSIKKLTLTEFYSEDESDNLKDVFENRNMGQLVQLTIIKSYCYDDNFTEVIGENCPLLRSLSLLDCPKFTDTSLQIMTKFKELTSLTVSDDSQVTDTGLAHLVYVKRVKCRRMSRREILQN